MQETTAFHHGVGENTAAECSGSLLHGEPAGHRPVVDGRGSASQLQCTGNLTFIQQSGIVAHIYVGIDLAVVGKPAPGGCHVHAAVVSRTQSGMGTHGENAVPYRCIAGGVCLAAQSDIGIPCQSQITAIDIVAKSTTAGDGEGLLSIQLDRAAVALEDAVVEQAVIQRRGINRAALHLHGIGRTRGGVLSTERDAAARRNDQFRDFRLRCRSRSGRRGGNNYIVFPRTVPQIDVDEPVLSGFGVEALIGQSLE